MGEITFHTVQNKINKTAEPSSKNEAKKQNQTSAKLQWKTGTEKMRVSLLKIYSPCLWIFGHLCAKKKDIHIYTNEIQKFVDCKGTLKCVLY